MLMPLYVPYINATLGTTKCYENETMAPHLVTLTHTSHVCQMDRFIRVTSIN